MPFIYFFMYNNLYFTELEICDKHDIFFRIYNDHENLLTLKKPLSIAKRTYYVGLSSTPPLYLNTSCILR